MSPCLRRGSCSGTGARPGTYLAPRLAPSGLGLENKTKQKKSRTLPSAWRKGPAGPAGVLGCSSVTPKRGEGERTGEARDEEPPPTGHHGATRGSFGPAAGPGQAEGRGAALLAHGGLPHPKILKKLQHGPHHRRPVTQTRPAPSTASPPGAGTRGGFSPAGRSPTRTLPVRAWPRRSFGSKRPEGKRTHPKTVPLGHPGGSAPASIPSPRHGKEKGEGAPGRAPRQKLLLAHPCSCVNCAPTWGALALVAAEDSGLRDEQEKTSGGCPRPTGTPAPRSSHPIQPPAPSQGQKPDGQLGQQRLWSPVLPSDVGGRRPEGFN